jgi:hypothetical protein
MLSERRAVGMCVQGMGSKVAISSRGNDDKGLFNL